MSTIFLDRDGVINVNRTEYVTSWENFCFLPGAREAIVTLTRAGYFLIICTNQAGIAKGRISIETLEDIHHRMLTAIQQEGGHIERIYYCPHSRDERCGCRKPQPGMLLRARDELHLDMQDAVFIGDSITDLNAGFAAGTQTLLVFSGRGLEQFLWHRNEAAGHFHIVRNLSEAAEFVLKKLYLQQGLQTDFERSCCLLLDEFKHLPEEFTAQDRIALATKMLALENTSCERTHNVSI